MLVTLGISESIWTFKASAMAQMRSRKERVPLERDKAPRAGISVLKGKGETSSLAESMPEDSQVWSGPET